MYLLSPFILQNFKKILPANPELCRCAIFRPIMTHLSRTNFFGEKIINIIFIYLLAPFIVHNFKNILTADPELQGCAIYGPKMANLLKSELFSENLLIRLVPFIHAYLHA